MELETPLRTTASVLMPTSSAMTLPHSAGTATSTPTRRPPRRDPPLRQDRAALIHTGGSPRRRSHDVAAGSHGGSVITGAQGSANASGANPRFWQQTMRRPTSTSMRPWTRRPTRSPRPPDHSAFDPSAHVAAESSSRTLFDAGHDASASHSPRRPALTSRRTTSSTSTWGSNPNRLGHRIGGDRMVPAESVHREQVNFRKQCAIARKVSDRCDFASARGPDHWVARTNPSLT